jgi:hypothetical protein
MTMLINAINAKDIGRFSRGADEGMADYTGLPAVFERSGW